MANKPKPTHLKLLQGNPGRRPLNKNEPTPKKRISRKPPKYLTPLEREIWEDTMAEVPRGMVRKLDMNSFETFVTSYAEFREACQEMHGEPLVIETPGGLVKPNPLLTVKREAAKMMLRAAAELGFTPSSRSKISVDPNAKDDEEDDGEEAGNPFGAFGRA
jgi:P27 family predicted phage terminase small subunit